MLAKHEKKCISVLSFFSFAGYYAGLGIMFSIGLKAQSRLYSIPLRLVLTMVMGYLLMSNYKRLINNRNIFYFFLFFLFWCLYFIKVLWDTNLHGSELQMDWEEYILYSISYSILPFFTFSSIQLKEHKYIILNAMIFSGFLMGVICTFLYWDALITGIGRLDDQNLDTETLNPLFLSYAGCLTIVLCFYKLINVSIIKFMQKIYLYFTIILSFIMFFLGASRGSVFVLALSLPIVLLYLPGKSKLRAIVIILAAVPLVIWGSKVTGSSVFIRTSSISSDIVSGNDESMRIILWKDAMNEFINSPFLGGRIELKATSLYSGVFYPHNFFIEVLMATGIIGFLLLFPIVFRGLSIIIKYLKRKPTQVWILILLIQGLTIHFFSGAFYASAEVFIPLGLCYSAFNER